MQDLRRVGPPREQVDDPDAATERLRRFLLDHRPLVLTGAGISVAAGLPAYRDATGQWQHAQPMQHRDFLASDAARRRYWSRAMLGWRAFSAAEPSPVHRTLARWQAAERIGLIVTQNVDALHQHAGSADVLDLHGRLDTVVCLDCQAENSRSAMQDRLEAANPGWDTPTAHVVKPDGDTGVDTVEPDFRLPACERCGGRLKPDVVFYGDTVPLTRVEAVKAALDTAGALLVIGSSLSVYSGYRVARWAAESGFPTVLVNPGVTRADPIANVRLAVDAQTVLPTV